MSYHEAEQFTLGGETFVVNPRPAEKEYRQASPINRAEVKRRLLQCAKDTKAHSFSRVSKATLDLVEARVENMIRQHVAAAPSRGMTL